MHYSLVSILYLSSILFLVGGKSKTLAMHFVVKGTLLKQHRFTSFHTLCTKGNMQLSDLTMCRVP